MIDFGLKMKNIRNRKRINSLIATVKKDSVVLMVIERIKEALIHRELNPGDYLPSETELTKNLGVGKSSVREAIKMLQAMGVLEVRRGQGTMIRKHLNDDCISPMIFQIILEDGNLKDLLDLRIMFEPAFNVMAMKRATEEDIERIRKTIENFELSIRAGAQTAEDDLAFHIAILHTTNNPLVIKIGETIFQLFKASISVSMKNIPEVALKDHKRIFKAFCEKDEEKLREATLKSFEGWKKSLYGK